MEPEGLLPSSQEPTTGSHMVIQQINIKASRKETTMLT